MTERALSCYAEAPLGVRAHVRIRWHSCPFPAVARHLPAEGRILDLGCGHGLFALHLARACPQRQVLGVEMDDRKLLACERAAAVAAIPNLEFRPGSATAPPPGPWEAICIIDVLYLLEPARQQACIESAAGGLAPGGRLVVKEMARHPRWKSRWNLAQETVAVRVLRLTAGGHPRLVGPEVIRRWMLDSGLRVKEHRLDRGYPHPHHLLVGEKPPVDPPSPPPMD